MTPAPATLPIRQHPLSVLGLPPELLATLDRLTFATLGQLADYFRGHASPRPTCPVGHSKRAGLTSDEIEALRGRLTAYLTEVAP